MRARQALTSAESSARGVLAPRPLVTVRLDVRLAMIGHDLVRDNVAALDRLAKERLRTRAIAVLAKEDSAGSQGRAARAATLHHAATFQTLRLHHHLDIAAPVRKLTERVPHEREWHGTRDDRLEIDLAMLQ